MQNHPGLPFKPPPAVIIPDHRTQAMRDAVVLRANQVRSRRLFRAAVLVSLFLVVAIVCLSLSMAKR